MWEKHPLPTAQLRGLRVMSPLKRITVLAHLQSTVLQGPVPGCPLLIMSSLGCSLGQRAGFPVDYKANLQAGLPGL